MVGEGERSVLKPPTPRTRILARNGLLLFALMIRLALRGNQMADTGETETENVRFLAGQVHALIGFCIAVINTHPAPTDLSLHLDAVEHVTLAKVESTLVIEEFLDGVRNVFDRLRRAVADAEARQAEAAEAGSERPDLEEATTSPEIKERQGHP
jgi:hypothetical protein